MITITLTAVGFLAGYVLTSYKIAKLQEENHHLKALVDKETYYKNKWHKSSEKWRKMYANAIRRANGHEPENLVK